MYDPVKAALRIAKAEAGPVIGLPEGEDAPRNWEDAQKIIAAQRAAAYDASLIPLKAEEAGIVNSPEYQSQQAEALKAQSFNPTRLSSMQPVVADPGAQYNIPQFTTPRARAHETERVVDLAREIESKNARGEFTQALGNTWPVQAAEDVWNAAKAPKQVLMGELDPNSELAIKRMFDLSGALTMGSLPVAKADPTKAGIFGGVGAKTADQSLLKQAQEAHAMGLPEKDIWQGTGWWKAPDGNWKFEIPDQALKIKETPSYHGLPAERVLDHPELFTAYPALRDLRIKFDDLGEGGPQGYHRPAYGNDPGYISINKRMTTEEKRSVIAHEIQHRVQDIEGFAKGANPDQFNFPAPVRMRLAEEEDALFQALQVQEMMAKQNMSFEDAANLVFRNSNEGKVNPKVMEYAAADPERVKRVLGMVQEAQSLTRGNGYEGYRRTMGEVEARNVQARLGDENKGWSDQADELNRIQNQNLQTPPSSTMDIPIEKQLPGPPEGVLGLNAPAAPAMSAAPEPPPRNLSPIGLYSHGAESAQTLPQPRGTPQQFRAMLEKAGVKPDEMKGFEEAFAGQKQITREQAAEFFNERMPKVEETIRRATPEAEDEMDAMGVFIERASIDRDLYERMYKDDPNKPQWEKSTPDERIEYMSFESPEYASDWVRVSQKELQPPKFAEHTLPGSTNYREVLLRLNQENPIDIERKKLLEIANAWPPAEGREQAIARLQELAKISKPDLKTGRSDFFRSSHWDEPNVLAHLRMADRTGPNGERILHLEEIQSDWAQKGRKEGFKDNALEEKFRQAQLDWNAAKKRSDEAREAYYKNKNDETQNAARLAAGEETQAAKLVESLYSERKLNGVNPAPYVTNTAQWTDLALKRALKEAVDGGYDQMIITPGQVQAERYQLSKQVSAVRANLDADGNYRIAYTPNGQTQASWYPDGIPKEKLADYVGKELADKIVKDVTKPGVEAGKVFEGLDLRMGGEGQKAFYDKIVPTRLKELLRKIDPSVKVGAHDLDARKPEVKITRNGDIWTARINGQVATSARLTPDTTEEAARGLLSVGIENSAAYRNAIARDQKNGATTNVLSIPITPKMREAIQRGLPAFKHGGSVKPSEAQIEAGNYKKEHVRRFGLDIAIENKKGSTRSGTDKGGKAWSVKMPADYGYIKRTEGADGDHVDVYLGPSDAEIVFVVNQVDLNTRKFDEHKVLLGFDTFKEAMETYKAGFSDGRGGERAESAEAMTIDQFKKWLDKGDQNKMLTAAAMNAIKPFGPDAAQRAVKLARSKLGATQ